MREATVDIETALEYCKALLNAETEEEIETIKGQIAEDVRANGMPEEAVQNYIAQLENAAEKIEHDDSYIIDEETGQLVRAETPTQELVEIDSPQSVDIPSQANTKAGLAVGLAGAVIVTSMALKRKILDNKKDKTL